MNLTPERLRIDPERLTGCLQGFIKAGMNNFNRDGIIIGLSGGLDSSLVPGLSVAAVRPERVMGLIMPERDSQPDSESDARLLANEFKVDIIKVELTPILNNIGMYQHIPNAVFASRRIAATVVKDGYKLYTGLSGERPLLSGLMYITE